MFENNTYASIGESLKLDYGQWLQQCSSDGTVAILDLANVLRTLELAIAPTHLGIAVTPEVALNDFFSKGFISLADMAAAEENLGETATYSTRSRQPSANTPSISQQAERGTSTWDMNRQQKEESSRHFQQNPTETPASPTAMPSSGGTAATPVPSPTAPQVRTGQMQANPLAVDKDAATNPAQWGQPTNTPPEKEGPTVQPQSEKSRDGFQKISGFMDWAKGPKTTGWTQAMDIRQPLSNDPQNNNTITPTAEPDTRGGAFPSVLQSNTAVSENQPPQRAVHQLPNIQQDGLGSSASPFSDKSWEKKTAAPNPDTPFVQETQAMPSAFHTQQTSLPAEWPQALETYPLDPIIASSTSSEALMAQLTQHLTEAYQRYYGHAH